MAVVDKLKGGKSVLQRTKPGKDLPRLVLYVGIAPAGYAVRAPEGTEHVLTQQVLASHYKVASGKKAAALMQEHWPPEAEPKTKRA